jgi:hypothetical protein
VCVLGYSDYDVFLENDEGSRVYRCKGHHHGYGEAGHRALPTAEEGKEGSGTKKLFLDTFIKHIFKNFEPFLANRALKFQKSANMT